MRGLTPTQRTLRALRDRGLECAIVEKWIQATHTRQDMFGIIDIVALDPQRGVIGVQSTGQDFSGHYIKLTQERAQETLNWLNTPGTVLELWGWRKLLVKRGGKAKVWTPRIHVLTVEDVMGKIEVEDDED